MNTEINACGPCLQDAHNLCKEVDAQGERCGCRDADHKPIVITGRVETELMLQALRRFYREPVSPISRYCRAITEWANVARGKVAFDTQTMLLAVRKSNLLYRLLYAPQKLRTVPCPEHQGRWPGAFRTCKHGCTDGSNITGWLPEPGDHRALEDQELGE